MVIWLIFLGSNPNFLMKLRLMRKLGSYLIDKNWIWLRKSTLLDLTENNANHSIPSHCNLPASCKSRVDRYGSLESCRQQTLFNETILKRSHSCDLYLLSNFTKRKCPWAKNREMIIMRCSSCYVNPCLSQTIWEAHTTLHLVSCHPYTVLNPHISSSFLTHSALSNPHTQLHPCH